MDDSNATASSSSLTSIDDLPDECLTTILSRLGAVTVGGMHDDSFVPVVQHSLHSGLVCRRWRSLADNAHSLHVLGPCEGFLQCRRTLSAVTFLELGTYDEIPVETFEMLVDLTPNLERLQLWDSLESPIHSMTVARNWTHLTSVSLESIVENMAGLVPGVCALPLERLSIDYCGDDVVPVCSGLGTFTGSLTLTLTCSNPHPAFAGFCLRSLRTFHLHNFEGRSLPKSMALLTGLETFSLSGAPNLRSLPNFLGHLTRLRALTVDCCDSLRSLPSCISKCQSLRVLSACCKLIQVYKDSLWSLQGLQELRSFGNSTHGRVQPRLLSGLTRLTSLESFHMDHFVRLPEDVGCLSRLRDLHLSCWRDVSLRHWSPAWRDVRPSSLCWLGNLKTLGVGAGVCLVMIPRDFGILRGLRLETDECGQATLAGLRCLSEGLGQLRALQTLTLYLPSMLLLPDNYGMRASGVTLVIRAGELLARERYRSDALKRVVVKGCPSLAREDGECYECCECCNEQWWWFQVEKA